MKTYTVRTKRWTHGWELHVDDVGVTQSRRLADAERQAREYVALMLAVPEDSFNVRLAVTVDQEVDKTVQAAVRLRQEADRIQAQASEAVRSAVTALTKIRPRCFHRPGHECRSWPITPASTTTQATLCFSNPRPEAVDYPSAPCPATVTAKKKTAGRKVTAKNS